MNRITPASTPGMGRDANAASAPDAPGAMASAPGMGAPGLVRGPSLAAALEAAERVASLPVDVLLTGETGAGKDTMAEYIHARSGRSGPFVPINCAAVPEPLFESELFGAEAGAFTGATRCRQGLLQRAHGGTLYLDEIESMPLPSQGKLLRVLQDRRIQRLGSTTGTASNFRVLAAAKTGLSRCVANGTFRQDLYFRLSVVEIRIPPLREREGDIVPLFAHFARLAAQRYKLAPPGLDAALTRRLMVHDWPGNVRELKSCAERAVLGLPFLEHLSGQHEPGRSLREQVDCFERLLISKALYEAGSVQRAAKMLGLPVQTLYYRMRRLGLAGLDATDGQSPDPAVCFHGHAQPESTGAMPVGGPDAPADYQ